MEKEARESGLKPADRKAAKGRRPRIIVGVSGASGAVYAQRFLKRAAESGAVETHLVITRNAKEVIAHELGPRANLSSLAFRSYAPDDLMAPVCSGSFVTEGMIILPCSMKTVAGLASGYADNLLLRAADVIMKEKRRLLIAPRETPLSPVHLENLTKLANWGVHIFPACPGFYHHPHSLDDLIDQFVFRLLDAFGLKTPLKRWGEPQY